MMVVLGCKGDSGMICLSRIDLFLGVMFIGVNCLCCVIMTWAWPNTIRYNKAYCHQYIGLPGLPPIMFDRWYIDRQILAH